MLATANEIGVVVFDGMTVLRAAEPEVVEIIRAITEERLDRIEQANRQANK